MQNEGLLRLYRSKENAVAQRKALVEEHRGGDRLTVEEDSAFKQLSQQIKDYSERIAEMEQQDERLAAANQAARRTNGGTRSSAVYGPESRGPATSATWWPWRGRRPITAPGNDSPPTTRNSATSTAPMVPAASSCRRSYCR